MNFSPFLNKTHFKLSAFYFGFIFIREKNDRKREIGMAG